MSLPCAYRYCAFGPSFFSNLSRAAQNFERNVRLSKLSHSRLLALNKRPPKKHQAMLKPTQSCPMTAVRFDDRLENSTEFLRYIQKLLVSKLRINGTP